MSVIITINAENGEEARRLMSELLYNGAHAPPSAVVAEISEGETGNHEAKAEPGPARRTRKAKNEEAAAPAEEPQIRTNPEDRKPVEEPAAVVAQDKADEAAEQAAKQAKVETVALTHDDVRGALKKYADAYGMPATMEDGPWVFEMIFGEGTKKVSEIPDTQEALAKAVSGVNEMLAKNPRKRTPNL